MNATVEASERRRVLDHGYMELVGAWGSDENIIEAARMSTGKGFKGWGDGMVAGDERLLRYLWTNKHATPFEMAGLTIEVKAPIFVFRQWHRHRTQSYNEMSARYTPLPNENYVPSVERLMVNATKNKQAGTVKGSEAMTVATAKAFQQDLLRSYEEQEVLYQQALCLGAPKELARIHLPVARYSRMRASANLRNWLAFMTLRCDAHAQHEIRMYADALSQLVAEHFPRTHALWSETNG